MIIKEYRVVLPLTVDEYHIGQLYMVAKKSAESTKDGEGIEILVNEPYSDEKGSGQYTHKIIHLGSSLPRIAKAIIPSSALRVEEKAWNAFPYCKTMYSCPFFGEKLTLIVETIHKPGRGEEENALNLSPEILKQRVVDFIDIVNDPIEPKNYKAEEDPTLVRSEKANRGPLDKDWRGKADPVMTCYKLVTVEFKYWGVQTKAENFIHDVAIRDVFLQSHRALFCWLDDWFGMDIAAIRALEATTKEELNKKIAEQEGQASTTKS